VIGGCFVLGLRFLWGYRLIRSMRCKRTSTSTVRYLVLCPTGKVSEAPATAPPTPGFRPRRRYPPPLGAPGAQQHIPCVYTRMPSPPRYVVYITPPHLNFLRVANHCCDTSTFWTCSNKMIGAALVDQIDQSVGPGPWPHSRLTELCLSPCHALRPHARAHLHGGNSGVMWIRVYHTEGF